MSIQPTKKQLLALAMYGYGIAHPEMSYTEIGRLFGVKRGEPSKRLSEIRFRYNLPSYRYKGFEATKRRRHNAMLATEAQRQFDALVNQLGIAEKLPTPQGVYVAPPYSKGDATIEEPAPTADKTMTSTPRTLPDLLRERGRIAIDLEEQEKRVAASTERLRDVERLICDRLATIRSSLTTVD